MLQQEFLIERNLGAFSHLSICFPYISWELWWKMLALFLDPLVLHPLPASEFLVPDFAQLCPSRSFEQGFWVDLIRLGNWRARSPLNTHTDLFHQCLTPGVGGDLWRGIFLDLRDAR